MVDNICQDYEATLIYQCITDWEENFDILIKLQNKSKRNQKKEKEASSVLKKSTSDWRTNFSKTSVLHIKLNYYMTNNNLVKFIDHYQIGIVIMHQRLQTSQRTLQKC